MPNASAARPIARQLRDQAHALIAQAKLLKSAGETELARDVGRQARALDLLSWGYVAPVES